MRRPAISILTVFTIVIAGAGCGKSAPKEAYGATPDEAALAFAKAMQAGDAETAASYWAYNEESRRQNEDWDSFPSGQRGQIIAKVREERIAALGQQAAAWKAASGDLTAQAAGDAVTIVAGGAPVAQVTCVKAKEGYQVIEATTAGGR